VEYDSHMVRVLVQIPCLNEESSISEVISSVPRSIDGVDRVDVLVIDDSSSDRTIELALASGADYIIEKKRHRGLANSFSLGASFFLARDYDVLVNTDGDNQYDQVQIPNLIRPIVDRQAELCLADRQVKTLPHFSRPKKWLQKLGSKIVSVASTVFVPDAATGFRAYSRDLVANLNVTTSFSYAMETLIQAGNAGFRVASICSPGKNVDRPSRLFRNSREHVLKSAQAILRAFVLYRPLFTFLTISAVLFALGTIPFARYLIVSLTGNNAEYLQSLILGTVLLLGSFSSATLAILADSIRANRMLVERQLATYRLNCGKEYHHAMMLNFDAEVIYSRENE